MRYFLTIDYLGTAYRGWQRQLDAPTVQAAVEEVLGRLLGAEIEVVGCGRTDTGVHAKEYVAHFDSAKELAAHGEAAASEGFGGLLYHANSMLPGDIALTGIRRVNDDAHARFDARQREYTYNITTRKEPLNGAAKWWYSVPLDVAAMNAAAAKLLTVSDFTTFAKTGSDNRTNICRVTHARWEAREGELVFTIRADRFLRNMVRAIVGTLVDVGRGKISAERFGQIVEARDLGLSSGGAPARGLILSKITYFGMAIA